MKLTTDDLQLEAKELLIEFIEREKDYLPYTLGVKDLIDILPHSESQIYNMLRDNKIPASKLGGKWIVTRAMFLAWLLACDVDESIYERPQIKVQR